MENGQKIDILGLLPDELSALCASLGQPSYRAKQIFAALSRGTAIGDISSLPITFRETLKDMTVWRLPTVERKLVSRIDGTVKYLFRLYDGECVESVLMQYEHGSSLCISSQVGCRMGCAFCASTIGGKVRDLYASELLGQVIAAACDSGKRIDGIVMMGIGEPLDNYENVVRFLRLVGHKDGVNIGYRHISLSTSGIVPAIDRLAKENFPITLSISLHAVTDEGRSAIMPVNRKWGIRALLDACVRYYRTTGRRLSFEYTLLAGKNDSDADADALAALLKNAFSPIHAPIHVNLIRVNEVKETSFVRGEAESAKRFAERLCRRGVNATVRRRLGADINAACGQLRRAHRAEEGRSEES